MSSIQSIVSGSNRNHGILIFAIFLVGVIVRVAFFGDIPGGLNQDEASTGYEAYAISVDLHDRNGFFLPSYLVGFGSGLSALSSYLLVPIIWIFGLTPSTTRSVNLISGILSLILIYRLCRILYGQKVAISALFILSICPWHIMLSRWGLDCNLFPFAFLLAVTSLVEKLASKSSLAIPFFLFAISLYSYSVSYLVVPIFLIVVSAYLVLNKAISHKQLLIGWSVFFIFSVPIGLYVVVNLFHLETITTPFFSAPRLTGTPRFNTVTVFGQSNMLTEVLENIETFLVLLWTQNDGLPWNQIPEYGIFYIHGGIFVLIGLIVSLRKLLGFNRYSLQVIPYFWLIAALSVVPILDVNINRINIVFIPILILCSCGLEFISRNRYIRLGAVSLYLFSFLSFSHTYFTTYPFQIGRNFFESAGEAIQYSTRTTSGTICVSDFGMPQMQVLFFEKIPPQLYRETVVISNPGAEFQAVSAFGRYIFGLQNCTEENISSFVISNSEIEKFASQTFDIKRFKYYSVATPRILKATEPIKN